MASKRSTIKVIKSDYEKTDHLEIRRFIADCAIPSSIEFDQPLSDFRVRFDHYVDEVLKEVTAIVSITHKLHQGNFDVKVELECAGDGEASQKSSVSGNCIIKVCSRYTFYNVDPSASISVKISSTRTSSQTGFKIADYNTTNEVYVGQKKFLNDLYNSRESTGDVTIVTAGGAKHKAHNLILGTRSPFFKTVFEVNLKERKESKVKIDKFEEDLVVGLIEFMDVGWTDSVETNPEGLLEIAHMYQVADLVKACWGSLIKTLNVKTAAELYRLIGRFGDEDGFYKKKVGRFLFRNIGVIRKTEEFAVAVKENVELFVEICGLNF